MSFFRTLISTWTLVLLASCSSSVVLFDQLSQDEANVMYSTLVKAGIPAQKAQTKNGVTLSVPKLLSSDAIKILEARGLPRDKRTSLGEVFKKDNLISSPLEEKARYLHAISQELEKTLLNIDGVVSARVHIVLPEKSNPGAPLTPSSAAVFVKYENGTQFPAYAARVRDLVFHSIPGITGDPNNSVTVTSIPSDNRADTGVTLIWFGPIAMHPDDRGYFLALVYSVAIAWAISLALVWLQNANPENIPDFIKKIQARFKS